MMVDVCIHVHQELTHLRETIGAVSPPQQGGGSPLFRLSPDPLSQGEIFSPCVTFLSRASAR